MSPIWPPDAGQRPMPGSLPNPDRDQYAGLVACWPCDEGSGRLIQEYVHGLHATSFAVSTIDFGWTGTSDFGPAPRANASNWWTFPNHPILNLPQFTIAIRSRIASTGSFGGLMMARGSGQAGFQFTDELSSTSLWQPHLVVANAAGTETFNKKGPISYAIPMTQPHSFVWTCDGTTVRFWADGVEQTLANGVSSWSLNPGFNLSRGYNESQGPFADVRIYNAARPELGPLYHDPATRWDLYRPTRRVQVVSLAPLSPPSPSSSAALLFCM